MANRTRQIQVSSSTWMHRVPAFVLGESRDWLELFSLGIDNLITRSGVGRNQSRVDLTLESDFSRLFGWHLADLSTQFTYRSNEDKIDPLSGWL